MNVLDPEDSLEICINKCPDEELTSPAEVKQWCQDHDTKLCRYDYKVEDYDNNAVLPLDKWGQEGPCPELPVYPRYVHFRSYFS